MGTFLQDLKFGARLLAKAPGFTVIAALSLALGIGANTTIFTLINAVLLNPLPVEDPSQLVSVFTTDERNQGNGQLGFLQISPMNYKDLRDKNEVFAGLAAHTGIPLSISADNGEPQQVFGEIVTGNYFSVLGARPSIGRTLPARRGPDARRQAGRRARLRRMAEALRRRSVDRRAAPITLNGQTFAVVGVMPKGFKGTNAIGAPALWVPYMTYPVTDERILPRADRAEQPPRPRVQCHRAVEAGRRRAAGRSQPEDDRAPARAGIPEREQGAERHARAARAGDDQPGLPQQHRDGRRPADDDRRPRAAHRVRQRGEPAARARGGAAEGNRRAAVARREPRAADHAAAHRRHAARAHRRRGRPAARVLGAGTAVVVPSAVPSRRRHRSASRSAGAAVHARRLARHRHPVRAGAGGSGVAARSRRSS